MSRLWRIAPLLVVGMVWGGFLMGDDKKEPIVVSAPHLPNYYNKLGLTTKQKNEILKIRVKYAAQIQELQQKISDLKDQEKEDCEKVLTSAQRDRLKEIVSNPNRRKSVDDEDAPTTADKKKTATAKDKTPLVEIKN